MQAGTVKFKKLLYLDIHNGSLFPYTDKAVGSILWRNNRNNFEINCMKMELEIVNTKCQD